MLQERDCRETPELTAYIEGKIAGTRAAEIEEHLATCDECFAIFVRIARQHLAGEIPVDGNNSRGGESKPNWRHLVLGQALPWVAVFVIAVALTFVFRGPIRRILNDHSVSKRIDVAVANLVDAVGERRVIEARLTGGFRHGPVESPTRSGSRRWIRGADLSEFYRQAEGLFQTARDNPKADHFGALGVALVVLGQFENAVEALEKASQRFPESADVFSNLAAAHLARAAQSGAADLEFENALMAATKALGLEPDHREARFNLALIHERLMHRQEAIAAWEAYLTLDLESEWAAEAKERLAKLRVE